MGKIKGVHHRIELKPLKVWRPNMRKSKWIEQTFDWVGAVFIALLFGRFMLWSALEYFIRYNIPDYGATRALYGSIFLTICSISFSGIRDMKNKGAARSPIDNISVTHKPRYFEIVVFGLRLALVGYMYMFWSSRLQYQMANMDTIFLARSDLFPTLLALGLGVLLIMAISGFILIFEPWRVFLQIIDVVRSRKSFFIQMGRFLSILILNLLLSWYFSPWLETKLPVLMIFVASLLFIAKFQESYRKAHKDKELT
jgi:hypothetical protein